jgi:hypothetical protein
MRRRVVTFFGQWVVSGFLRKDYRLTHQLPLHPDFIQHRQCFHFRRSGKGELKDGFAWVSEHLNRLKNVNRRRRYSCWL